MPTGIYKRTVEMKTGKHMRGRIAWNKGVPNSGFKRGRIPHNKGIKMPKEYCEKLKYIYTEERRKESRLRMEKRTGELSPNWKGGITPINIRIRNSKKYKDWRIAVFEKDCYTCQGCGSSGVTLQADHIKPFAYYPELRLVIENGRTLCVPCHKGTDTYAGRGFNKGRVLLINNK